MTENQANNDPLFLQLVLSLSTGALQHLGKLVNPATGKPEIELGAAQAVIDMLDMLEAKTKGNRTKDEEKMLRDTITTLKLNFVEVANAQPAAAQPQGGTADQPGQPANPPKEPPTAEGGHSEPRFHKKYD